MELDPAALAHFQLGTCLQAGGRFDQAMAEDRRAIEPDPKGGAAHFQLGACWRAGGQLDQAMAEFRRAIELDPKGGRAHHALGMCRQDKGQLDEAMAEYRRAIELDPKGGAAHFQLGACWQEKEPGSTSAADRSTATCPLNAGPDGRGPLPGRQVLSGRGQLDEAMAEFRRAHRTRPQGARPTTRSACAASQGQLDGRWLSTALSARLGTRPTSARRVGGQGRLDTMAGYLRPSSSTPAPRPLQVGTCSSQRPARRAMADTSAPIELEPQGAVHHHLGMCLQAKGQLDEAMAEYRRIGSTPGGTGPLQLGTCLQARAGSTTPWPNTAAPPISIWRWHGA